ncbi:MAG TPA: SDR family oxidoreductase [Acidimicrobiales bacterium]|nr:SDR family oxidoreductase [Acidimicrobiales bacterium]
MTSDLFSISGKTAVVTGGSRGIGLMIARGFVEAGAKVYVSSRKAEVCDEVAAELSKIGECIALPADLSSEAECRRLADEVAARESQLHILVNNAGATWGVPLEQHDDSSWDRVIDLNVKGVFHLTKFLLPLLQAAGTADDPARVINIGSIDGIHVPILETYSYSSSKAAVHQLTRHLAKQLAPTVTVNAIAPGPFESKMMAATLDAFGDQIARDAPMKRIGRPDDMAGTAIFLSSRAASFITGTVLPVDGGIATCK